MFQEFCRTTEQIQRQYLDPIQAMILTELRPLRFPRQANFPYRDLCVGVGAGGRWCGDLRFGQ